MDTLNETRCQWPASNQNEFDDAAPSRCATWGQRGESVGKEKRQNAYRSSLAKVMGRTGNWMAGSLSWCLIEINGEISGSIIRKKIRRMPGTRCGSLIRRTGRRKNRLT